MEDLKKFLDDIRRIRTAVEKIAKIENGVDTGTQPVISVPQQISESVTQIPVSSQPIPTQTLVQAPAQTPVQIPTASESFTQEQIAVAMSNAVAAGRNDIIQSILSTFNAQCLMQIDPANYNQIAVMLREAGFQV